MSTYPERISKTQFLRKFFGIKIDNITASSAATQPLSEFLGYVPSPIWRFRHLGGLYVFTDDGDDIVYCQMITNKEYEELMRRRKNH